MSAIRVTMTFSTIMFEVQDYNSLTNLIIQNKLSSFCQMKLQVHSGFELNI